MIKIFIHRAGDIIKVLKLDLGWRCVSDRRAGRKTPGGSCGREGTTIGVRAARMQMSRNARGAYARLRTHTHRARARAGGHVLYPPIHPRTATP